MSRRLPLQYTKTSYISPYEPELKDILANPMNYSPETVDLYLSGGRVIPYTEKSTGETGEIPIYKREATLSVLDKLLPVVMETTGKAENVYFVMANLDEPLFVGRIVPTSQYPVDIALSYVPTHLNQELPRRSIYEPHVTLFDDLEGIYLTPSNAF